MLYQTAPLSSTQRQQNTQHNTINSNNTPQRMSSSLQERPAHPNGSVLKDEISRRVHFLARENEHNLGAVFNRGKLPRPHNWSKPRCIEWLEDPRHPMMTYGHNISPPCCRDLGQSANQLSDSKPGSNFADPDDAE